MMTIDVFAILALVFITCFAVAIGVYATVEDCKWAKEYEKKHGHKYEGI